MLRFMLVMVPLVFVINGLTKGNWDEAFFFAVAVAVGLTPEMLPMIVTVCLSKGAMAMGRKKVIVKRLNAIQNLGAMDVLCTDKTGTLTMDQVILEQHCDVVLKRGRRRARAGVPQQPLPDRPEERARPRGARAHGDARARRHPRATPRSTRSRSTSSAGSCRSWSARPKARTASSARAPRGDLPALHELRARRQAAPDGPRAHRRPQGGVRAAQRRRLPRAGHRQQGRRAARRVAGDATPYSQGRRVRPDPQRLRGVPRSAQGDRRARRSRRCRGTASRSRSSPATTNWWPARSARRSGSPPTSCCWAARSRR